MNGEPSSTEATAVLENPKVPTREVAAATLLATFGAVGVFVPLGLVGFVSLVSFSSGHGSVQPSLDRLSRSVDLFGSTISILSIVAVVAAVGLYRRRSWGRATGLIVAGLLVASAPAWILFVTVAPGWSPDDLPVLWGLLRQLFGIYDGLGATVPLNVFVGSIVGWGLLTRPRDLATTSVGVVGRLPRRPRRLGVLMGALVIFGLDALLPYLAWLAGPLRPPSEVDESGQVIPAEGPAWDWTAGLVIAIASLLVATVALVAARSIRSRRAEGPYLVPAATAVSATWAAVWVFLAGAAVGALDGPAAFLSLPLYALAFVAVLAFPFALWAVLSRRAWFDREPAWMRPAAGPHTNRPAGPPSIVVGAALILLAPIAIMAAAWAIDPPPEPLDYSGVLFEDRAYRPAAPLIDVADDVATVGTLSAWTESLREVVSDPTVYAFLDTPAERAIAVRTAGSADYGEWPFVLFVRTDDWRVPSQLCRYVPIEDPRVSAAPCGPPDEIVLDGRSYLRVQGFEVGPGDVTPLDALATTSEPADDRVDLKTYAIRDVPTQGAIALRLGTRITVYQTDPKVQPALELCRYSPDAMANPLGDTSEVPYGCGLPPSILVDGLQYSHEQRTDELLSVPASALSVHGKAIAFIGEGREAPFPPTIDDTAYAIEGVAPADAVALKVGDRVIAMRPNDTGGGLPVPASLCRYVVSTAAARMEAEGEGPVGCP